MKKVLFATIIVATVILLVRHEMTTPDTANSTADTSGTAGKLVAVRTAPEFDLEKIAGGQLKSADLKGKVVVVDLWATWCDPCKEEIPKYNDISNSLDAKSAMLIGFTMDSGSLSDVKDAVGKLGIQYPVVMSTDDVAEGLGGYSGYPTTYILGKDWKVYKKYVGAWPPDKKEQIQKDIAALLLQ